jgi:Ulp1 family protease
MTTYEFATLTTPADAARKHAAYMRSGALADKHTLIYPCHVDGNHWVVLVATLNDRLLHLYDSIEEGEPFNSRCLPDFLRLLWKARRGEHDEWNVVAKECTQQLNKTDCGIFCLDNIETIIAGRNPVDDHRVRAEDGNGVYYRDMAKRRKHYGNVLRQETLMPK